jgi:ABC-2 type transport system ATP-binding protein
VDEVVVISAGRLVAQAPLDTLLATHASHRVRVRTTQPDVLLSALAAGGFTGAAGPDGAVLVTGCPAEQIGRLALDHQIVLSEITDESASLEETFLELTTHQEEVR